MSNAELTFKIENKKGNLFEIRSHANYLSASEYVLNMEQEVHGLYAAFEEARESAGGISLRADRLFQKADALEDVLIRNINALTSYEKAHNICVGEWHR